ncbi:hypothetical protein F4824DRAFT_28716 [Ustulina deusta]|nr:hypothetical protein F4824DRAFT_28716 [Ustulina deusta]
MNSSPLRSCSFFLFLFCFLFLFFVRWQESKISTRIRHWAISPNALKHTMQRGGDFCLKDFPREWIGLDWLVLCLLIREIKVAADRGNEMLLAGVDRLAVVRLIFALSISMRRQLLLIRIFFALVFFPSSILTGFGSSDAQPASITMTST